MAWEPVEATNIDKGFKREKFLMLSLSLRAKRPRDPAQDKAILNLLNDGKLPTEMSLENKLAMVQKETEDILHDDEVVGNL